MGNTPSPAARPVPPASSPLAELAHAVLQALELPRSAPTKHDELARLRTLDYRADAVCAAMKKIISDPDAERDPAELMIVVTLLRYHTSTIPAASYDHKPEPTL